MRMKEEAWICRRKDEDVRGSMDIQEEVWGCRIKYGDIGASRDM